MSADRVPNQHPTQDPGPVRLAIVGEAPAVEECSWSVCSQGHGFGLEHWLNRQRVLRDRCPRCGSTSWEPKPTPFVGESGRLLDHLLEDSGLPRAQVFVGNCSQTPLAEGEKTLAHCEAGLAQLHADLVTFAPTCVLVLGGLALAAFLGEGHSILDWRGSIFSGHSGYKCVAARHPAAILREPTQLALLRFDVRRAVEEAQAPGLYQPKHSIVTPITVQSVVGMLVTLREIAGPVGYDIEGTLETGVTVFSFAMGSSVLSVPLKRLNFAPVWSKQDEGSIMHALRGLLQDPAVPKVMHNASYEMFVHRWLHGIEIVGVEDTMLAWHVLYPELLKDLSVVASVLTRQPYWGKPGDWATDVDRDTYNAIDSTVTLEAWRALSRLFTPAQRAYYEHTRDLIAPCLEMSFEGMGFDSAARDSLAARIQREVFALQGELDSLAGILPPSFSEIVEAVAFARHRDKCQAWSDIVKYAKPSFLKRHSPVSIDSAGKCAILE